MHRNRQYDQALPAIPAPPRKHFHYSSKKQLNVQEYQKCY